MLKWKEQSGNLEFLLQDSALWINRKGTQYSTLKIKDNVERWCPLAELSLFETRKVRLMLFLFLK